MPKSNSRNSNTISIDETAVSSVVEGVGNIHVVTGTITFNANISTVYGTLVVKVKDDPIGLEEDISSSIVLVTHTPKTQITYRYEYDISNTNLEILTPNSPLNTSVNHELVVDLNGSEIYRSGIDVDSCRKYMENLGDLGGEDPAFELETYDFTSTFNFDLYSYVVDSSDEITFYCDGVSGEVGITDTFDNLNSSDTGSTPDITYSINSSSGQLAEYTYELDDTTDIKMKIEKPTFSQNNEFTILNAYDTDAQKLKLFMDFNFDGQEVPYSVGMLNYDLNYKLYIPVWEDVTGVAPTINFTGDISGAIVGITTSNIGAPSSGEVLITVTYHIDNQFTNSIGQTPVLGANFYTGNVEITLNNFTIHSGELTWTSVKT